jgi:hypothetical protein
MSGAPTEVAPEQLAELGIEVAEESTAEKAQAGEGTAVPRRT